MLVGDFASFDDPRGQKMLRRSRGSSRESLTGDGGKSRSSRLLQANRSGSTTAARRGRCTWRFVIPNPLLPEDFFSRQEVDEFVMEMNADVTHSLLDCPGRYTVRVATFTGAGTFKPATAAKTTRTPQEGTTT